MTGNTRGRHGPRAKYATKSPSSRFKGVSSTRSGAWTARLTVDGVIEHLGSFEEEIGAARAFDTAARAHFGEDAITNASLGLLGGAS